MTALVPLTLFFAQMQSVPRFLDKQAAELSHQDTRLKAFVMNTALRSAESVRQPQDTYGHC
jgi:uncharacterized protein (DUF1778 family)